MRFVSTSFQQSSSFYARTSGSESGSLISSSFFIVTKTDLGGFDANFGTKKLTYTIPSASTGGSADVKVLTISASGDNPKIGIGTQDPKATFDIKEERDDTIGTRFLLKSSRTATGAQIGDSAGSINFAIDSASFNDIFSSGSVASIDSKVRAINTSGGGTPNVAGNIIFKSSPEWIEILNEVAEIGYFHFDNLDPTEDSEPGMIINGQLTVGSGSTWQSQAGDVAFSVHNVDGPNIGNNHLKFRITGSNAVIHSGSLAIGSGSLFLGETYSGANQVEVLNLRGQNSIKLGHINGGGGNHGIEFYASNTQYAKLDVDGNFGIGTTQNTAPEKLTVEGNISASGNLIATDFVASGNITVTGNVDGVDISALNSTVSTNTSNITALTAATSSYLTSIPTGTVSSSVQIDHDQTTNFNADEHFTQANITTVGTVTSGDVSAILPSGTVSGSSQTVANLDGQNVTVNSLTVKNSSTGFLLKNSSGTSTYVKFSPQGGLEIDPGGVGNSISASSDITTHGDIIGESTHIKLIGPDGGGGSFTYLSSSGDPSAGSFKLSLGDIDGVGNTTTLIIDDNNEQISLSKALNVTGNITVTGNVDGVDIASLENSVQTNDFKIANLTAATSSYSTATGVENNADVTDFTNVQAAGALMDSEVTSLSLIKGLTAAQISGAFNATSASLAADIPTNNNQLTNGAGYTTNTGTVTSVGGTGTVSGLSLSGTVTTSGNLTLGGTISISSTNITDVDAFSQTGTYASLRAQGTTAGDVGLGNVTNESKATMFTSPTFTGTTAAPTPSTADDSTKIATTAYVQANLDDLIGNAGAALDTLGELSASLADATGSIESLVTEIDGKLAKSSNLSDLTNAATARTNLGVDAAGTDNSTDVTLAGSYDYITISGQTITRNQVDASTDISNLTTTNVSEGTNEYYTDTKVKTKLNAEAVVSGSATNVRSFLNVENGADVTDTANVTAAGALMDSEVTDLDGIKSLTVPNNTTISTFGASLVDDANAATARTTLGVDAAGTDNSTDVTLAGSYDYITISGQQITRNQIDASTDISNLTTTNVSEGTNEYYTDAKVKTKLNTEAVVSGSATNVRSFLNVEDGADVTDTANVTAAGALMDSEVDADIKTLSLPANTTISTFGASLVDDTTAAAARTTLGVDAAGTDNSTDVTLTGTPDYITISGQTITRNQIDLTSDVTGQLPAANLGTITSAKISDVDAFSQSGTYASLRAQGTTAADVGLGNVTNESKATMFSSPTFTGTVSGVTKTHVGLGNVENTALSTYTGNGGALDNQYITNGAGYTTNTGTVTSVGGTGTVSGLSLSGTVTTSGNLTLGGTISISSTNITDVDAFSQSGTYASLRAQGTTADDVGLGNVTNESKATMFASPTFTGTVAIPGFADVSASLAAAVAGGDNLGNHTATQNLNMGGNAITNVGNVDGVDVSTLKSDFDTLENTSKGRITYLYTSSTSPSPNVPAGYINFTDNIVDRIIINTSSYNGVDLDASVSNDYTYFQFGEIGSLLTIRKVSDGSFQTYKIVDVAIGYDGNPDQVAYQVDNGSFSIKIESGSISNGDEVEFIWDKSAGIGNISGVSLTFQDALGPGGYNYIEIFKGEYGGNPVTSYIASDTFTSELTGSINMVAALSQSANLTLGGLTVNGNISVTGNVDGVDVSTLKSDFDTLEGKTLVSSSAQIADVTLTTAAQTNITSLGILNSLTMGGDIDMDGNTLTMNNGEIGGAAEVGANVVRIGNGSTTTPSLAFTNDTNTGIYSVATDTLGIVTGGTNRLTIGTSATTLNHSSGTGAALTVTNTYSSTNPNGAIAIKGVGCAALGVPGSQTKAYGGYFLAGDTNTANPDTIALYAQGHEDGAPNSYAAIFSGSAGGVVGINTMEPTVELDVVGDISASNNIVAGGDLSINGFPSVSASLAAAGGGGGGSPTTYRVVLQSNCFLGQADKRYLPFNSLSEQSGFNYISLTPAAASGQLISITVWPQSGGGSTIAGLHVNSNATATATDTQTLSTGAPTTFTFSSATFSQNDELSFSIDPTSNPNGFSAQIILEYDL